MKCLIVGTGNVWMIFFQVIIVQDAKIVNTCISQVLAKVISRYCISYSRL